MDESSLDFSLPAELEQLQADATEMAMLVAARSPFPEDSWLVGYDREVTKQLGDRGWIGMTWPVEDGGHGRTALERFVVYEALIGNGAPISAGYFADRQIGPTLLQFGTAEQRRRWLPGIVEGASMWCIGMSEPDAGSDVANVHTSAVIDGDAWVVNGGKLWTSGAAFADWIYLIARTGAPGHGGLSEFVVDMRSPGVEARPIRDMTGNDHFCEVHFDAVRLPTEHLVGTLHGSFRQVMRQLEHERGGLDRLLSNYALYRDLRATPGVLDTRDALIRQQVAAIESVYRIVRLLILRQTLGQAPSGYSSLTKVLGTEFEQRVANFAAQVLGARAMVTGADLGGRAARAACYAPAYTIMGGTSNIMRNILAERVLGMPR